MNDSIKYLSTQISEKDSASSSHWDYYHKDFKYEEGKFIKAGGVGMHQKPYNKVLKVIHNLF